MGYTGQITNRWNFKVLRDPGGTCFTNVGPLLLHVPLAVPWKCPSRAPLLRAARSTGPTASSNRVGPSWEPALRPPRVRGAGPRRNLKARRWGRRQGAGTAARPMGRVRALLSPSPARALQATPSPPPLVSAPFPRFPFYGRAFWPCPF